MDPVYYKEMMLDLKPILESYVSPDTVITQEMESVFNLRLFAEEELEKIRKSTEEKKKGSSRFLKKIFKR